MAVLTGVLLVQLAGAGTPTEKLIVTGALVPTAFVAVNEAAVLADGVVGVPEITPETGFKVTPAGRVPLLSANDVSGVLVAEILIGVIATPKASAVVVPLAGLLMTGAALGAIVKVTFWVPVSPPVLRAPTVTVLTPLEMGVPEITPVAVLRVKPLGSVPVTE